MTLAPDTTKPGWRPRLRVDNRKNLWSGCGASATQMSIAESRPLNKRKGRSERQIEPALDDEGKHRRDNAANDQPADP